MRTESEKIHHELVRSDLNLEKWEIFGTNKYKGNSREIIRNTRDKEMKVIIGRTEQGKETGILTTHDGKVFYGLLKLWEKAGKPDKTPVQFTIGQLASELKLPDGSLIYRAIRKHLYNLAEIPIKFIESYKTNNGRDTLTAVFHLVDSLSVFERNKDNPKQKYFAFSRFKFNDDIINSIKSGYIKPLRLDILKQLKSEIAFIVYRHIDIVMFDKTNYEIDLITLSDICGLSKHNPAKKTKQVVSKALKELIGKDLSHGRIIKAEIQPSQTPSGWKCVFMKGPQSIKIPANLALDVTATHQKEEDDLEYFNSLNSEIKARIKNQAEQEASQLPGWEMAGEHGKQILVEVKILEKVRIQKKKKERELIQKEESVPPVTNPPVPPPPETPNSPAEGKN